MVKRRGNKKSRTSARNKNTDRNDDSKSIELDGFETTQVPQNDEAQEVEQALENSSTSQSSKLCIFLIAENYQIFTKTNRNSGA